jgi:hypothetical protein
MPRPRSLFLSLLLAAPLLGACGGDPEPSDKVCTPGADQTCNDDPAISSLHGKCNADSTCTCSAGFMKNAKTGRCL